MKLKFKKQAYQTQAVEAVVDCFKGQPNISGISYRIDPGASGSKETQMLNFEDSGFKNADLAITERQLLENIQAVQYRQNLPQSESLVKTAISPINLDIEMETGTGKTYCYIKTCYELNKHYGWSKFIVVVPSIAIREGVYKSLDITSEHFLESYGKKIRFFVYNSKQLHNLESFSSDAGINVMVINTQAFNSAPSPNASQKTILNQKNRIYRALDEFQSRRPIDVIKANRPILILDEPQKIEGESTHNSLKEFNPLMILRYSATHKTHHNKVHRLDALDAYNQKLVKKIAVRGISAKGLTGTNAYIYLDSIEVSRQSPVARIEMEIKQSSGIKRTTRKVGKRDDLFVISGGLNEYEGFVVSDINANTDTVSFTNGIELTAGEATGDVDETLLRRIQIREAIRSHLQKEQVLYYQGIKVLTLFFIDEVAKYRQYVEGKEQKGEYAEIFEVEYQECLKEIGLLDKPEYKKYLDRIDASKTHNGYFSIDKRSKQMVNPKTGSRSLDSDDVDAYDLILKDKERLLSMEEPVRFIFSHSALREGWDNPNVFVICTLKHSDNTISRRQEVGRGLRIAVNQIGERQDNPATVHETNVLTVVASESYRDFVAGLQKDISESLSERPRVADVKYFTNKILRTESGDVEIDQNKAAQIEFYLIQNSYVDVQRNITSIYREAVKSETLAELPTELKPYRDHIFQLIDSVYSDDNLPAIDNDRKAKTNPLNSNFEKKEFKELWSRINKKAAYKVDFDSQELIKNCVSALEQELKVTELQYSIIHGVLSDGISVEDIKAGQGFRVAQTKTVKNNSTVHSKVKYDLVGKISEEVQLTRKTVAEILSKIQKPVFDKYKTNPENFISEVSRIINEQKATMIIEHLTYDTIGDTFDIDIFTEAQTRQDFSKAGERMERHIYDYVITDSKTERSFVNELDKSNEVVVYAKLPKGFFIPTPVGHYNPDWAIAFQEGAVKHIYFVAETKGSMSSMQLKQIELTKIECARKFFEEVNQKIDSKKVKYDFVDSYGKLMDIVGVKASADSSEREEVEVS